ncbi:hypothetical protein TNCT6_03600 [Streptomyces sp. 6-11-2]|nr:hypothetical protein TNCT6_03600 [Streptomyces sp. 6-11-2]
MDGKLSHNGPYTGELTAAPRDGQGAELKLSGAIAVTGAGAKARPNSSNHPAADSGYGTMRSHDPLASHREDALWRTGSPLGVSGRQARTSGHRIAPSNTAAAPPGARVLIPRPARPCLRHPIGDRAVRGPARETPTAWAVEPVFRQATFGTRSSITRSGSRRSGSSHVPWCPATPHTAPREGAVPEHW